MKTKTAKRLFVTLVFMEGASLKKPNGNPTQWFLWGETTLKDYFAKINNWSNFLSQLLILLTIDKNLKFIIVNIVTIVNNPGGGKDLVTTVI